jgi:hypothetical protein
MDAELLELQRQLEAAQSARSSVRLSERNVVELVQKLQERGIIDFELLHTTSGKEYITSVSPFPIPPGSVPLTCGFSLHFVHNYTNATRLQLFLLSCQKSFDVEGLSQPLICAA